MHPKVHYRVHTRPPPVPVFSQINPIQTLPFYFLKSHFNIILSSRSRSLSCLLPSSLLKKTLCTQHSSPICATFPAYLILQNLITLIIFSSPLPIIDACANNTFLRKRSSLIKRKYENLSTAIHTFNPPAK